MKKVALVVSHVASGSTALCQVLDKNPRVQWCRADIIYDHPDTLEALTSQTHKLSNSAAVWLDDVLYNFYFTHKSLYQCCKFIYVVRDPRSTLNTLVRSRADAPGMLRYYTYRLRRICEMARRTPGAVLLTWDDMVTGRGFPLLEKYLYLKEPLVNDDSLWKPAQSNPNVTSAMLEHAQRSYERYLYYLRNLKLRRFE
jgi:hypothetical protein